MSADRDLVILRKIVENCDSITSRIDRYAITESIFINNSDYREMILFPLVQIGELANHLTKNFISRYNAVPWSEIVGMRHIIVHGYGTIDPRWAWRTIQKDIPVLKLYCEKILDR